MQIHADRSQVALVRRATLDWVMSPLKGVDRLMLERDGDEVARATTIVRYAPESYFSPHTHTGGEEFLVLDGVFSDEHGDFPKGTYVRNPVGSAHKPFSKDGCVILVKLWQMPPEDQVWVRKQTEDFSAYRATAEGVSVLPLHTTDHETVEMVKLAPGATMLGSSDGGFEFFVVDGAIDTDGERLAEWNWMRLPSGKNVNISSTDGALLFVKRGHLAKDLPLPTR